MIKCEGSHMRCAGCACPCHGKLTAEDPRPKRVRARPAPTPRKPRKAANPAKAAYMRAYRKGVRQESTAIRVEDLPTAEILQQRVDDGSTISDLAREFQCDRRTVLRALGRYPLCPVADCPSYSARVGGGPCRNHALRKTSQIADT